MSIHLFILAGGSGTRLWPLSKAQYPKQFLKLASPYSLLQQTLLRFCQIPYAKSYVLTVPDFKLAVENHLHELGLDLPLIIEPERKNTLPSLCHALNFLKLPDTDLVLILPTDHVFDNVQSIVHQVEKFALHPLKDKVVVFGADPYYPETGYGYIHKGQKVFEEFHKVERFIEKPSLEIAMSLLESKETLWNTGLLLFQVGHLRKLIERHAPLFADYLIGKVPFTALPSISIDYALLEKTTDMLVYPVLHKWVDLGSWDRLYHYFLKDQNQNVLMGDIHTLDTKNSLIMGTKKKIATLGLDDMLIIDTEDILFIGKKSRAQEIKELRALLKENSSDEVERSADESPK